MLQFASDLEIPMYKTHCESIQEHKIGPKDLLQIRSNTITMPMIISASCPGSIPRLKTSFARTTPLFFTLFLDILATGSPLKLRMQQFRLWNEPLMVKSGTLRRVLAVAAASSPRKTSASALDPWKRRRELLLTENSLGFVGLAPDLLQPQLSPLYAFHWLRMLHIWLQ